MGCGKTLTAIAIMGAAYQMGRIKKALVLAPSSVCPVWPKELAEYADFEFTAAPLIGAKKKRLDALETLKKGSGLLVAVINYEGLWRDGIFEALISWCPDFVVCDESQRIKDHKAMQSKAVWDIGKLAKYRLILSGTPVQNQAVDLFGQYRFLDSSIFGQNFYVFRNRYFRMGGFNRKQIIGLIPERKDELVKKAHSIAYRVTKAEALDLPEQTFITRSIPMEGEARKLYNQLRDESYAELEGGGDVTAATVLVRLLRLQQLAGGFLRPDEGGEASKVWDGKLDALSDIIEDYVVGEGKKLVVFCRFRAELSGIAELLGKRKLSYVSLSGETKMADRGELVRRFQEDPNVRVFLAQIDTAGLGITLTAADTCVYYSLTYNYASYSQSLSRIHRIGQANRCTYIHLIAEKTVDEQIMKTKKKKEDLAKSIVDDWRKYFEKS